MNEYILTSLIGSCRCQTKTPEIIHHKDSCMYKQIHMAEATFERWFLSIPDVDERLLEKSGGNYRDADINFAFITYVEGIKQAHNGDIRV